MNLAWWLERAAREFPDNVALIDHARGEEATYRELAARADLLGAALREDARVRPDEVVATIMADDIEHVALLFGLMKIGAVFSGYNRILQTAKFAQDAERARVRTVIVSEPYIDVGRELLQSTDCVEQVFVCSDEPGEADFPNLRLLAAQRQGTVRVEPRREDQLAAVNFTGGTGGTAKGVIFTHGKLGLSAQGSLFYDGLTSRDRNLSFISLYHSGGIHDAIKWVMAGATNILTGGWTADLTMRLLEQYKPTWIYFMVTTMARDLMAHPKWDELDLTGLHLHVSGEVVPAALQQAWIDRGARVMNAYGLTETMPIAITKGAFVYDDDRHAPLGCSSRPAVELCEMVLKDPATGHVITTPGVEGEVCARGGVVTPGYYNDDERTSETFDDEGYLHTKDLAVVDDDGWLWISGRTDDIINAGGEKLSLTEVENVLRHHPLVADVACIGVAHARFGQIPGALIETTDATISEEDLGAALDEHCRENLERWKRPRLYGILSKIPRTEPKRTKDLKTLRALVAEVLLSDSDGIASLKAEGAAQHDPERSGRSQ
jgi:fatty-acyl-CoA synthase